MLARENPHCGVSGVPFMNKTTGDVDTALSIACRVSVDRSRSCEGVRNAEGRRVVGRDRGRIGVVRVLARRAWGC
jgi:hypothetical protein